MATLDVLSGGRVEFGLGAGWMNTDYEQSGIPLRPRPAVRVDRIEEGIAVIEGPLAAGPVTVRRRPLHGQRPTMALPKPVQQPHPPFLIGGGGKRVLAIAGREADIVGINPDHPNGDVDAEAGRRLAPSSPIRSWSGCGTRPATGSTTWRSTCLNFACSVTDDRQGVAEKLAPLIGFDTQGLLDFPHTLIGTVDELCETLEARRRAGDASYIVVQHGAMEDMAPVVARLSGTTSTR